MSGYDLTRKYPVPVEQVWRALTDPDLVAAWTVTGQGARPVNFAPVVGTKFQFVGKPTPGWNGVVDCEVLEVRAPNLLSFTWLGGAGDDLTTVTCTLEAIPAGTGLRWEHTGFSGIGGFVVAKILGAVRKKMLDVGLPAVLQRLAAERRP
jgi:uncharacterized protein YndB with AHSA1/START domain